MCSQDDDIHLLMQSSAWMSRFIQIWISIRMLSFLLCGNIMFDFFFVVLMGLIAGNFINLHKLNTLRAYIHARIPYTTAPVHC